MSVENLSYYLEQPERISELTTETIVQWISQKPYCQNLRFLLAKKKMYLGEKNDLGPFYSAATYAFDRTHLVQYLNDEEYSAWLAAAKAKLDSDEKTKPSLIQPEEKQETQVSDEAIEENESLVETHKEENEPVIVERSVLDLDNEISAALEVADEEEIKIAAPEDKIMWVMDKSEKAKFKKKKKKLKKKAKKKVDSKKKKKNKKRKKKEVESKEKKKKSDRKKIKKVKSKKIKKKKLIESPNSKVIKALPEVYVDEINDEQNYINEIETLSPFTQWLMNLRTNQGESEIPYNDWSKFELRRIKKRVVDPRDLQIEEMADKSLEDNSELISEPLALILIKQGHLFEAIEMYEKLSLKYPEKMPFFAAKIEELKSKE